MLAYVKSFWVPKRGNMPEEYEDAFWIGPDGDNDGELDGSVLRMALADGASESLLASRWANLLVACFGTIATAASTPAGFLNAYESAASKWDEELAAYKAERDSRGAPIQWFEEPGLAKGAYATILAVEFRHGAEGEPSAWTASCLGDSCLFQVRDESLYVELSAERRQWFFLPAAAAGQPPGQQRGTAAPRQPDRERLGTRRQLLPCDRRAGGVVSQRDRARQPPLGDSA